MKHNEEATVGKQLPLKEVPSKTGGPFKEKEMIEDEKVKRGNTSTDVVSARRATNQNSNRE